MNKTTQMPADYVLPSYRSLSLIDLIKKIVANSDHQALAEFHHNRTLFSYNGSAPMLFIDYLNELRKSTAQREWPGRNAFEIADIAYDLTIDKFNNIPSENRLTLVSKKKNTGNMKHQGSDCRLYFRAHFELITKSLKKKRPKSQLEEEYRASRALQGLVRRHFYLSCLEAERKLNPFWSRYYWDVKGIKTCVWLPVSLKGQQRRAWLEKNIDDPDPSRSEERRRIQAIINRKFVYERLIKIDEAVLVLNEDNSLVWPEPIEMAGISLAKVVAKEKAVNIRLQRRSIWALGKKRLKQLILRIFEDIGCDGYNDSKVAKDFGLSKATFSRFAGSQWFQKESSIPDLWLNTAQVLSSHSIFKDIAINMGIWNQIEGVLEKGKPRLRKGSSHE